MKKQFPIISFEHASFQYEGQSQESLKDVKLIIKSGEFLVITGQSGCGKTTLTRCINNLIPRFFEGRLYPLCVPIFFSLHDVSGKPIVVTIGSYYIFPCSS